MKQKFEKLDKSRRKDRGGRSSSSPDELWNFHGCPVPEPIVCSGDKYKPECMDEGILMECTNVTCPFKEVSVHEVCFKAYEDHLIRTLKTMGSARGWCEAKLRTNLWEKKGQGLLAKVGRCRCGHGFTRRNEEAFFARQKRIQEEELAHGTVVRKKKHHRKELPTLNFPKPILSAQTEMRTSRPGMYLSSHRRNSSSLTMANDEWEDDSVSCYSQSDQVFDENSSVFLCSGAVELYSTVCKKMSTSSLGDSKEDESSQRSLSSAIVNSSSLDICSSEDGEKIRSTDSTESTKCDPLSALGLHTPPCSSSNTESKSRFTFVDWSPFGTDFNLGETVLATQHLPIPW